MTTSPPNPAQPVSLHATVTAPPASGADRRRLKSEELFGPASHEVEIAHGSEIYRLRRTSLGKLILTK